MAFRHLIRTLALAATLALTAASAAAAAPRDGAVVYSTFSCEQGVCAGGLHAVAEGAQRQLTGDPRDTEPAVSPDGQTVAFVREGALYTVPFSGSAAPQQLTTGTPRDSRPIFSPDGGSVLFEREQGPYPAHKLYLIGLAGGVARQLAATDPNVDQIEADFSSDGGLVSFAGRLLDGSEVEAEGIYSVRADGSDLRALTSPTGRSLDSGPLYATPGIVFTRYQPQMGRRVFVMRRDGSRQRLLLPERAVARDVSGDGLRLLYSSGKKLKVRGLRQVRPRPVEGRAVGDAQRRFGPVLSPSGKRIALVDSFQETISVHEIEISGGRDTLLVAPLVQELGGNTAGIGHRVAWQPLP